MWYSERHRGEYVDELNLPFLEGLQPSESGWFNSLINEPVTCSELACVSLVVVRCDFAQA